jgi:hypothetical protein
LCGLKIAVSAAPELPVEPLWKFYPELTWAVIVKHARVAAAAWRIFRIYRRVAEGAHIPYTDQAMTPVTEDEIQTLELFTHSTVGARGSGSCPKDQNADRPGLQRCAIHWLMSRINSTWKC